MTKIILSVFVVVIIFHAAKSQDTAKIVANSEVIKISESEIITVKKNIQNFTSGIDKASSFFDRLILIGPKLWNKIKDLPDFNKIQQGNITFKVPKFEKNGTWRKKVDMNGKAIQTLADFKNFWNYLEFSFIISKSQIVDMNVTDKYVYWQYFAKIEEAAQAIQTNNTRLVLLFVKDKLFFIELTAE